MPGDLDKALLFLHQVMDPSMGKQHTFDDLLQGIEDFAARHNATKDVVFEVWFNHIHHRIRQQAAAAEDLANLISIPNRPQQCTFLPSLQAGYCQFVFHSPEILAEGSLFGTVTGDDAVATMLAVFVTDNLFPSYRYTAEYGDKLQKVLNHLFPPKPRVSMLEIAEDDERAEEHKETQIRLLSLSSDNTVPRAEVFKAFNDMFFKFGTHCSIPIWFMLSFLRLGNQDAEAAMQRIKAIPELWHAYSAAIPDAQLDTLDVTVGDLDDPTCFAARTAFLQMVSTVNTIAAQYQIDCTNSYVVEHSLAKMYGAGEVPNGDCIFKLWTDIYTDLKRDFAVSISISAEAMERMVANINASIPGFTDAANVVDDNPPTMRLSYAFMQQDFLPRLAEFMASEPELVKQMQIALQENVAQREQESTVAAADVEDAEDEAPAPVSTPRPRSAPP